MRETAKLVKTRLNNQKLYKFKLNRGKSIHMVANSDEEAEELIQSLGGGRIIRLTRRGVPL